MISDVYPCGCMSTLKVRQKSASVACRKRLLRREGEQRLNTIQVIALSKKLRWPALVTLAGRPGSEQRPVMLYYGYMNVPCWYTANRVYVEVVTGDDEVAEALQRAAACIGGHHLPSTGPIHAYLFPTAALVAAMVQGQAKREARNKRAA
jgi:hypothetical protein